MPTRGQHYTREEIAAAHGGSAVEYLPRVGGRVVCACLRTDPDYNPEAPRVILPGRGPVIEESAAALIDQRGPIPVYIKRSPHAWEYVGDYEVERSSRLPDDLVRYEAQTGREVTCVIFMRAARFQFTVTDTFLIEGRGLILAPFFPEPEYHFDKRERVRVETPDHRVFETDAEFEIPMVSPTPKVFELVCLLRNAQKPDVPIGSRVSLVNKTTEQVAAPRKR